jgi:glycosyltransferase involved in cell wall biosynthesis
MATHHILFVSHDATRTGAPIELLHFLRWFKRNSERPFSVLLGRGGELVADFEELADTWSIDRSCWRRDALRTRLLFKAGLGAFARLAEATDVQRFAARCPPAMVYTNSIASARAIEMLAPRVPIVTHVHELEFPFRTQLESALSRLLAETHQFIACSNAVRENLVRNHAVPAAQIETIHESIPVADIRAERTREQVLRELRIPDDALFIIGAGTASWRKGTDLFIQLARAVCRQRSHAYFAWIGDSWPSDLAQLDHDVRLAGLTEKVRFTGAVLKPADYLAAADVFVLTSREDPYPLVCLEAAAVEKPIVCFAGAGGMPEFVEEDCGFVVPYLDIMAMADRVVRLLDSLECRVTMGAAARRKVTRRHDISQAAPRIMEIIERAITGGAGDTMGISPQGTRVLSGANKRSAYFGTR